MKHQIEQKIEEKNRVINAGTVMCNSCDKEIKPEDDKHCFFDDDIEEGIKPECLDCYLDRESVIRDFGF